MAQYGHVLWEKSLQMCFMMLLVSVQKDIQISQRLMVTQLALKGQIVIVDIVLSTTNGKGCIYHIIDAYTLWNPGGTDDSKHF